MLGGHEVATFDRRLAETPGVKAYDLAAVAEP
jgi:hypothetical protein